MKILVTGGVGFIGYHSCIDLCNQGHDVILFDNLSENDTKRVSLLTNKIKNLTFFYGDVNSLHKWNFKVDAILHLANSPNDINNKNLIPENISGFVSVCEFAKTHDIPKVVYASSQDVYSEKSFSHSETDLCEPVDINGIEKMCIEKYAHLYNHYYGIQFVGLRYFHIYGNNQNKKRYDVIAHFLNNIRKNKPLTIFGDGSQIRNFVHVNDVAKINAYVLTNKISYNIINVGCDEGQSSINELVNKLNSIIGSEYKLDIEYKQRPQFDKQLIIPNLDRLKEVYSNFDSMISLHSGLRNIKFEL